MKLVPLMLSVALLATLAAGCGGRAQAKTTPDDPPLDVPAPPPRDIEPAAVEPPLPVVSAPEPPRAVAPRPQPARPAPTREQPTRENRPEPAKPEAKPETGEPVKPASPPTDETKPAATLQTKPAVEEGDVERGIRATLTQANADLNRVDYRKLNTDARSQYDYAKRFIFQAEEAIRAKNLVFAKTVADKAAALAAQLAGR